MSYNVVTAWWIVKIFLIYTFMVVVLPYFVLRRFLKERSWTQKFVFSVVEGIFSILCLFFCGDCCILRIDMSLLLQQLLYRLLY